MKSRSVQRREAVTSTTDSRLKAALAALSEAQHLFGMAEAFYSDDRNPNRADKLHRVLKQGFDLCLNAIAENERPK